MNAEQRAHIEGRAEVLRVLSLDADTDNVCLECPPGPPAGEPEACSKSQRPCGHHCNHVWTHDVCCWCGKEWGEEPCFLSQVDAR